MKQHEHSLRLLAYLDGEISAPEREAVEARMAACADCRRELEALRALHAQLDQAQSSLELNLWPGIEARLPRRQRSRGLYRVGYALLVLFGLSLGALAGWTSVGGGDNANSLDFLAESSLLDQPLASFGESYLAATSDGESAVGQ